MNKVIFPDSFKFDAPVASLVNIHSRGVDKQWLTKRAAVLSNEIANVRAEPGQSFIHLIAMGASQVYGNNRNGDSFSKTAAEYRTVEPCRCHLCVERGIDTEIIKIAGGLKERHHTFVSNGNVFRHHQNKNPEKRIGVVKASAYNEPMERVELLIKVDNNHFADDLEKLASGNDLAFSMAVRVPHDFCSYCGHLSVNRAEYCKHARDDMTAITKEGHQICVHNPPGTFFDISRVTRPADPIAWSLEKVASAGRVIGSAEMAEIMGVRAPVFAPSEFVTVPSLSGRCDRLLKKKAYVLQKLSEIEKTIEGLVPAKDVDWKELALSFDKPDGSDELSDDVVNVMKQYDMGKLTNALSDAKIILPVKSFFKVLLGSKYEEHSEDVDEAKGMLPGIFSQVMEDGDAQDFCGHDSFDGNAAPGIGLRQIADKLMDEHSFGPDPTAKRIAVIRISGTGVDKPLTFMKSSSGNVKAAQLAREYACYQLSFCNKHEDFLTKGLTVLSNYIK